MSRKLLSVQADYKTRKCEAFGYLTGILYLAPYKSSGRNLCPDASPGCIDSCLFTAGRGVFEGVRAGRLKRSEYFRVDREGFMRDLVADIAALVRKTERMGLTPMVRLNGTSDIPWENVPHSEPGTCNVMALFPDVQFYDYTKNYVRMLRYLRVTDKPWPANYSLTFSRSECNEAEALNVLRHGGNVSVVFSTKRHDPLPERWRGFPVADGNISDARPADYKFCSQCGRLMTTLSGNVEGCAVHGIRSVRKGGVVIGLRAKGRARKDRTGFVVPGYLRCPDCSGRGRLDNPRDTLGTETCPTCAGTGTVGVTHA